MVIFLKNRLEELRKIHGINQEQLADALEVNISSPKIKTNRSSHSPILHQSMQIVYRRKHKIIEENKRKKAVAS